MNSGDLKTCKYAKNLKVEFLLSLRSLCPESKNRKAEKEEKKI